MAFSVVFSPVKAFEDALVHPSGGAAFLTAIFAAVIFAVCSFLLTKEPIIAAFFLVLNFVQWLVLAVLVWFFSVAHVRKKKGGELVSFAQSASVTSKLWQINLMSSFLMLVLILIMPFIPSLAYLAVLIIFGVLFVVLFVGWIVASYKMLKVVTSKKGFALFINWIIVIVLNALILSFISGMMLRLIV